MAHTGSGGPFCNSTITLQLLHQLLPRSFVEAAAQKLCFYK